MHEAGVGGEEALSMADFKLGGQEEHDHANWASVLAKHNNQ
jgi:hypothetical protein